jgi:lysophospholipase L1-like esterase
MVMLGWQPVLAATGCDRFALSVTTDPVPYQYPHGLEKAYGLLDAVPKAPEVVLVGDSLAANWPHDMLERQFTNRRTWNFAVGGSTTQNTLWQLHKLTRPMDSVRDVVVVIGTNNLTYDYMPACAIAAGIRAVTSQSRTLWPKATIHVMGIPPRGTDFHFRDASRRAVNAEIAAWTKTGPGLHFFEPDPSGITCGQYDRQVKLASNDGKPARPARCANYADDFGHFHRAGYEQIFKALSIVATP